MVSLHDSVDVTNYAKDYLTKEKRRLLHAATANLSTYSSQNCSSKQKETVYPITISVLLVDTYYPTNETDFVGYGILDIIPPKVL